MSVRVLLDACVLYPQRLMSLLLTLAYDDVLDVRWSAGILEELERTLVTNGNAPEAARRRIAAMRRGFPEAEVVVPEQLVGRMSCHWKDRHVLAAAVAAGVDVLLTDNLKDFPPSSAEPFGVGVMSPDQLLCDLFAEDPDGMAARVAAESARLRWPAMTSREYLAGLAGSVPGLANFVFLHGRATSPVPQCATEPFLVIADDGEAAELEDALPESAEDPLAVARAWVGLLT